MDVRDKSDLFNITAFVVGVIFSFVANSLINFSNGNLEVNNANSHGLIMSKNLESASLDKDSKSFEKGVNLKQFYMPSLPKAD